MFLTTGPSPEFMQFMRILCWIFLPVLLSAVLFTIIMHYRKRKAILEVNDEQAFLLASPEQVGYTKGDGEFILFDHSRLILEYKNRLTYNHARFTALQHDFAALEERYQTLNSRGPQPDQLIHSKISTMENQQETYKDQLSEQDYLPDLLEEKNAQISFLQTQLEQRVRSQRQAEKQAEFVKEELQRKQEESDRIQMLLCEREERQENDKQILSNKQDHISYLENQLRESKEHNEVLIAEVADSRDIVNNLQQQLADEQERRQFLDQRLQANKQNMRRLYKEFSSCIDEENERSAVHSLS